MNTTITVPFSEIGFFRVICKACQTAMDIPLKHLATAALICPSCQKNLRRPDVDGGINALAEAMTRFQSHNDVELQVVVPFSSPAGGKP